jgi:hypothetical protein
MEPCGCLEGNEVVAQDIAAGLRDQGFGMDVAGQRNPTRCRGGACQPLGPQTLADGMAAGGTSPTAAVLPVA